VPAAVVPMAPQIRSHIWNHNQVKGALGNAPFTARAGVLLGCLIGLHWSDGYVEKTAHAINATITASATTTMTTSSLVFLCSRKGLKPTVRR
jgi:hypothetical protein